ncbi:hypothetical protein B9Z65_2838 [Elsinoe australis]|uniref:Uncharacterized protein n=1 Tax=Elsinoe australis TaxID=40998 RepID=A0A2P8A4S7_9PEZI|nr:hypothetical protein B9Z65_2838 [Elsinoe australis]
MANFEKDIPELAGKVILVTGGHSWTRRRDSHLLGRNSVAAQATIKAAKEINKDAVVRFFECDLSNLIAVKVAATKIAAHIDRLDLVFCNAGIMATPAGLSRDHYEIQFATNHLGHAMLIRQLLPLLRKTASQPKADVRVISNTSLGYQFASCIQYDTIQTTQEAYILGAFRRYGQSKLANLLYAKALARNFPEITFVSIHPGIINTTLISGLSTFNRYFTNITTFGQQVTVQEGVKNQLWAATVAKDQVVNGAFYEPVGKPGRMTAAARNEQMAEELYEWTAKTLAESPETDNVVNTEL